MDDNVAHTDIGDEPLVSRTTNEAQDGFTAQVADYFGAYVSGALSPTGIPNRLYGDTYQDGLIRKLSLERFPQLGKNIYKNVTSGLTQQTFVITQNKYTVQRDDYIIDIIEDNIANLSKKELAPLLLVLTSLAEVKLVETRANREDIIEELLEDAKRAISNDLVVPYILPIKGVDVITDKHAKMTVANLREAVVSRLFDTNKIHLRHIYTTYFASETYLSKDSLMITFADIFTIEKVKDCLQRFSEYLHVTDAYQLVAGLDRTVTTSSNTSLFVYLCELNYNGQSFPLFYTKVSSKHTLPSVTLTFENRIFINTKAIDYVLRHFAAQTNQIIDLDSLNIPRVIYTAQDVVALQEVINKLTQVLRLTNEISLAKPAFQEVTNHYVTITNRIYLMVADSHDLTIIDDYDTILQDDSVYKKVDTYITNLLTKNSTKFVEEIAESWEEKSYFDRLAPTIPMSINDEQAQVLQALAKSACERIVIDSPDFTGKGHLIEASILKALSKSQTVLVVTDGEESAQHFRDAIAKRLHAASGRHGHNPVLDLHDIETVERIDDQAISDIAASARLVESKIEELATAKKRKKSALKEELSQFIHSVENINLHEVEQISANDRKFSGKNWIEDEPLEEISEKLQHLHRSVQYIRSSEASYLMPFAEVNQQKAVEAFISAYREYERASKNVVSRLPEFVLRYKKLLPEQRKQLQNDLAYTQSNYRQFMKILNDEQASKWLDVHETSRIDEVAKQRLVFDKAVAIARDAGEYFKDNNRILLLRELNAYAATADEIIETLNSYTEQITTLKSKLFGFSGRMPVVENLNKQLMKSLPMFGLPEPEKQIENMQRMSDFVRYTTEELAAAGMSPKDWKNIVAILLTDDDEIEELQQILERLNQTSHFEFVCEHKINEADNLLANIRLLEFATELNQVYKLYPKVGKLFGITKLNHLLARPQEFSARVTKLSRDLNEAGQLDDAKQTISGFVETYPETSKRLGILFTNGSLDVIDDTFANSDSDYIKEYLAHKRKERDIKEFFDTISIDSFANISTEYRQILGVELQHMLNTTLLSTIENHGSELNSLATMLKEQRKLTIKDADLLRAVFPCIVGDAKQISSILPFTTQTFDLVIIDTADSISIAEALPSILRAKKVLVIGDAAKASARQLPLYGSGDALYREQLSVAIRSQLSSESADNKNGIIAKQEKTFAANLSALDFFSDYAQYEASFKKQFGVYEEIASFGNKYYYNETPISLKSRAVPLVDLFTFTHVRPTDDQATRFTNIAEVDYIISHLHKLKEQGFNKTIGIITPFAEQAALLQKELDESVITDWFERRHLKVMTFDDARDHRRDHIIYSFVASRNYNELAQKLPSAVAFDAFDGDTRSHRLLAGMASASQSMHFVHSLSLADYGGALSEVLEFYESKLHGNVKVKGAATDVLLPAETSITQAFEKTNFAIKYEERLSFVAKYPFANYIKPLSPNFSRATYKVFFLAVFDDMPIVIEYDDFKERFLQTNKEGGAAYVTPQDVYGYKMLENYGYRFLRLNKFNIGTDASRTLDNYLSSIVKVPSWPADNGFVAK